jgi:acetyl esterase/lipase
MSLRRLALAIAIACTPLAVPPAAAQFKEPKPITIPIWPNGAPGSEARRNEAEVAQDYWVRNVHNPSLTLYKPEHQNGSAINIYPGGAHRMLVWTGEGVKAGPALNRYGITIFVLKYRLAREEGSKYTIEGDAADDARRAIRFVRAHAKDYGVDPQRIGVMGFSAGGELVTLVADNPEPAMKRAPDAIDKVSARPDFQVQIFPGPLGLPAKAVKDAPTAFLVAGSVDECCAAPTVQLYEQLRAAGSPAELHMYARAGHAFNMDESDRISVLHWPDRLADWMMDEGLMDGK